MNYYVDAPVPPTADLYKYTGITGIRYPGGSMADVTDWRTGKTCVGSHAINSQAFFDRFMDDVAIPAKLDVEITVNYGSTAQPACSEPSSPEIAASWVKHAVQRHYKIGWWEIGNEVWGSWEKDAHNVPHDAVTYAAASRAYVSAMKRADKSLKVGIALVGRQSIDAAGNDWDSYVLSHGSYDYVAYHSYNGASGKEDDDRLLRDGPEKFDRSIAAIQDELDRVGRSNTPISVSEWNSVFANPGKQSISVVNGLYTGEILAEMLRLGIRRAEFWNTFGCEFGGHGNYSPALYGWQDFASLGAFSEGVPFPSARSGCHWVRDETVPLNTPFPTARAFELLASSGFVRDGEHMLAVTVPDALADVKAYAATNKAGCAVLIFNLNRDREVDAPVLIKGPELTTHARWWQYGKKEYDLSRDGGPWVGLESGTTPVSNDTINAALPPWSMTVYNVSRGC